MKILFLNHNIENYGTYFRCMHLAKGLVRRGHNVTLLCAHRDQNLRVTKRKEGGLTTILLPMYRLRPLHTLHTLRMFYNTAYTLASQCEVLHAFAFPLHPIALPTIAAHFLKPKMKLVLDHDDLWKGGFAAGYPTPAKQLITWCNDNIPKMGHQFTAASSILMEVFRKSGIPNDDIHYIPNCPTIPTSSLTKSQARTITGLPKEDPVILSIGHLYTESLFLLLDAFEKARQSIPNLKLAFLGKMMLPTEFEARFQPYIARNNGHILRIGEKPPSEVPTYLACADALMLPMDDSPIEQARFPIRFGDYLTANAPIVSNAVGEIARFISKHKCGYAAQVNDTTDFSNKIIQSITDQPQRQIICENAKKLIKDMLNWDTVTEQLEKIYIKTLA